MKTTVYDHLWLIYFVMCVKYTTINLLRCSVLFLRGFRWWVLVYRYLTKNIYVDFHFSSWALYVNCRTSRVWLNLLFIYLLDVFLFFSLLWGWWTSPSTQSLSLCETTCPTCHLKSEKWTIFFTLLAINHTFQYLWPYTTYVVYTVQMYGMRRYLDLQDCVCADWTLLCLQMYWNRCLDIPYVHVFPLFICNLKYKNKSPKKCCSCIC